MSDNTTDQNNTPLEENNERNQPGPLDRPQDDPRELAAPTVGDSAAVHPTLPIRHEIPDAEVELRESAQSEIREAMGIGIDSDAIERPSVSTFRKRLRRFKSLKRGYFSFILLVVLYLISFILPALVNNKAIVVHYNGSTYFPIFTYYPGATFGQNDVAGEADYRRLAKDLKNSNSGNWAVMPPYTWNPLENDLNNVMQAPSSSHLLGTDDTGRDVFARMCYGFNVSISFALVLTFFEFLVGATVGGLMGYFGGRIDLYGQRFVEIWSNIPFLYTVIIISAMVQPSFMILILVIALFDWVAVSYYMRGEFYREKSKDYVAAAVVLGATDREIIFKHILPNSLTPLIARLPFSIIGAIFSLVSLDYLGYGLAPPTPSWGQMVSVGLTNMESWWLVLTPLSAMFLTLLLVTFIGEAVREAFDPRVFSRLR
jgi:microcin C transport system permease protein